MRGAYRVIIGAGLFGVIGLLGSVPTGIAADMATHAARPSQAVPVLAARVEQRSVPEEISTIGRVQTIASVAVHPRIDGAIAAVAVRDGQEVAAGDLLFTLDDRRLQAQLELTQAALARDRAQLESTRLDLHRLLPLESKNFVSRQQLDQQRAAVDALEATVRASEAAIQSAKVDLSYTVIRAPIAGRLGGIAFKEGSTVKTGDAIPLAVINQMQPIYVSFALPQQHLPDLRAAFGKGTVPVMVDVAGAEGKSIEGQVRFIENAIDAASNTISVKAEFVNADGNLWPGALVGVRVRLRVDENAIVVPAGAVQSNQKGDFVFVIGEGDTVALRPIVVARMAGELALIVSGLAVGERVVTEGQLRLQSGTKVEIVEPSVRPADQELGS